MRLLILLAFYTFSAFTQQTLPQYNERFELKNLDTKKLYFEMLQIKIKEAFSEVCRNPELNANWLLAEYFLNFDNHEVSKLYFFPEGQPVFVLRAYELDEELVSLIDFDFYTNDEATYIEQVMVSEYEFISPKRVENDMKNPVLIQADAYRNLTNSPCLPIKKPE